MSNNLQVIVLCEDKQHFHFARKYLEEQGINKRRIINKTAPPSQGSGAQYVIDNYANELKEHRSKNYQKNIALAVFLDEDTKGTQNRLNELESLLKKANLEPRQKNERVALFIPARNIETWFYYVDKQELIDETKDYKKHTSTEPSKVAKKLANDICPNKLPESAPPSLKNACLELMRLKVA